MHLTNFFIILIVMLSPIGVQAQLRSKNNLKEYYLVNNRTYRDKNKLLKKKDKITNLTVFYYQDSIIFPDAFILEFKNLEELRISSGHTISRSKPLTYKGYNTIKFDTLKLCSVLPIKILRFYGFDFKQFPVELSKLPNLKTLSIHYTPLDSIPAEIIKFSQLKELDLWGNCIVYVAPSIRELDNLEKLDLSHNKLTSIPTSIVNAVQIKEVNFVNNYGPLSYGYNFNNINFYNDIEIEKLQMLLYHSKVGICVQNCDEGDYVREKIDEVLYKKKLEISYKVFDCTGFRKFR